MYAARPPGKQSRKDSRVHKFNPSKIPDGLSRNVDLVMKNPMSIYYRDNFEMLEQDQYLGEALDKFTYKMISRGFVFILQDGTILVPVQDFLTIIEDYWMEFFIRLIRFYFCTGYVVWGRVPIAPNIDIPMIPDWDDISCAIETDEETGMPYIDVEWKNEKTTTQLYVCHSITNSGISRGFPRAPIDTLKPALDLLYILDDARKNLLERLALPDIVIGQMPKRPMTSRSAGTDVTSMMPPDSQVMGFFYDEVGAYEQSGDDDQFHDRVEKIKDQAYEDARENAETYNNPIPPCHRTKVRMSIPTESRYREIPPGSDVKTADPRVPDLSYNETRKQIRAEIFAFFDMAETGASGTSKAGAAGAAGSANSSSGGGGGGGAGKVSGNSATITSSPEGSTTYAFQEMIARIATGVFRILYDNEHISIADAKVSYDDEEEEVKFPTRDRFSRMNAMGEYDERDEEGAKVNADDLFVTPVKTAGAVHEEKERQQEEEDKAANAPEGQFQKKKAIEPPPRFENANKAAEAIPERPRDGESGKKRPKDEEEEGDKKKKRKVDEDDDDDDEEEEKKAPAKGAKGREGGAKKAPGAPAAPKKREEVIKSLADAKMSIRMLTMTHLLSHRDTAKVYMEQGGMSLEAFYEMHPKIETGDENKEEEKARKEMEKMKEKMAKEKEKMQEKRMKQMEKEVGDSQRRADKMESSYEKLKLKVKTMGQAK